MGVIEKVSAFNASESDSVSGVDEVKFQALLDEVVARRAEFQEKRHVPQDIIEKMQELGLYSAFVPEQLGGISQTPTQFMKLIERLSIADGSVGWVASFAFGTKYLSSLPAETLAEVYKDRSDIVFAGAVFPPQPARVVEGGVIVNGRWKFGSGCMGASLIGVGISIPDGDFKGLPLLAVMPAEKVKIVETWDTIGMSGTGSHDMVVEDVFVPNEYLLVRGAEPTIDTPAYRYPAIAMAAQVLAVCGIGTAQAAIDHIVKVAQNSKSITGAPTLGDRVNVQIHIAECEAKLQAARSWFYRATDKAWEKVVAGEEISRELNMELRLSSSHAAKMGADVARACFEMTGTMGIFRGNPLSQYLTDSLVTAQHAFLTEGTFMNAGRVMFGHPPIPGYG